MRSEDKKFISEAKKLNTGSALATTWATAGVAGTSGQATTEATGHAAEDSHRTMEYGVNSFGAVPETIGFGGIDTHGNGETLCAPAENGPGFF